MVRYAFHVCILACTGIYFYHWLRRAAEAFGFWPAHQSVRQVLMLLAALFVFPAVNIWGIWAVVVFHLLAFALCMDGVHSIWKYSRKGKGGVSGKRFEWLWASGLMPTAAVAVLLLYGWWNMHHIVRTSYTVYTDKLIRKEGYRIAFFSDLHYGTTMNAEALQSICLQIEQERADLLVLGGDLVDEHTSREEMKELFEMLSQVTTQYGIYYIYGNHDRNAYTKHPNYTAKELAAEMEAVGITVLRENAVDIEKELLLVGRDDRTNPDAAGRVSGAALVNGVNQNEYLVLLEHQPRNLKENSALGFDLQLSGHTHGGQIAPVGWLYRLTGFGEWNYGLTSFDGLTVIVTSGMGGLNYPIRTGKHSEYVIVDVIPTAQSLSWQVHPSAH